jgi:hypothetical protein
VSPGTMSGPVDPESVIAHYPYFLTRSLCLSGDSTRVTIHPGDPKWVESGTRHGNTAERTAAERLVRLKQGLKTVDTDGFWRLLMEEGASICNAQYAFAIKRNPASHRASEVAMRSIGEPETPLSTVAFYYNDGQGREGMQRDHGSLPCDALRVYLQPEKVVLIPEKLTSVMQDHPPQLPCLPDAYLAIPIRTHDKCVAHLGMMWSEAGRQATDLSWSYQEMVLHSLEDMVLQRILNEDSRPKGEEWEHWPSGSPPPAKERSRRSPTLVSSQVIPQTLQRYARSLSHELRTPMHGVVGMLDVMQVTLQEAIDNEDGGTARQVLQDLRAKIDLVQGERRKNIPWLWLMYH